MRAASGVSRVGGLTRVWQTWPALFLLLSGQALQWLCRRPFSSSSCCTFSLSRPKQSNPSSASFGNGPVHCCRGRCCCCRCWTLATKLIGGVSITARGQPRQSMPNQPTTSSTHAQIT
ncbi:uncharacterized protein B0I36DRAFT_118280 [Microdochium trichocladiopsis]|uniref:Secreted protein n=1 Tax=Microdochium trichocladiopsis TaxID=1682393 RepID=A0A9P8Y9C7_9PEZI|nr:uncharacterized protein B0I36DRAFT_118280 [Microdochium trichocladiopsis]KAH7031080.1 hypothetical protein B0I36DRAFT_118280 [Microdochium trichocladiopsis]